jgi:spore germination cell wall hydrolase CwlJ-like protein
MLERKKQMLKTLRLAIVASILSTSSSVASESDKLNDPNQSTICLAQNVYFEARGDNLAGKFAVADVVLNRVENTRYPNTICEVIKQGLKHSNGTMRRHKCQFSWYCDGKSDNPKDASAWMDSLYIAILIQDGHFRGITEGSTHYHATYVNPSWNKQMFPVGRIGVHRFFRSK